MPAGAAGCDRTAAIRSGRWFTARPQLPAYSASRQLAQSALGPVLRAVAVDPGSLGVVYVTDGAHLLRTGDGGCSWVEVYRLPGVPGTPDSDTAEIVSIDVARVAGRTRVLLAVDGVGGPLPATYRTYIVRSDDGVRGWTTVADVAGFVGTYSPSSGQWRPSVRSAGGVAYAAVPAPGGGVGYVRSADGGRTWTPRTLPDPAAPALMHGFAVNPYDPDELWEWGGTRSVDDQVLTGLRRSTDGGASWLPIDPWPMYADADKPGWVSADVFWPRKGAPARVFVLADVIAGSGSAPLATWSGDGGQSFRLSIPPLGASGFRDAHVTHLAGGDSVVIDGQRRTYRVRQRGRAPQRPDWVPLSKVPEAGGHATLGYDLARATATTPTVVLVPTVTTVQSLVVGR
jgi:hypothetical protein